jgi:hypothetical protein
MGGRVVMMKKPVVVVPKFWSFSSHIFSQASRNVTVKVRVGRNVKQIHGEQSSSHKKKTMSMLFVELWTCHAFFVLGDCGLSHCDDCCFVSGS